MGPRALAFTNPIKQTNSLLAACLLTRTDFLFCQLLLFPSSLPPDGRLRRLPFQFVYHVGVHGFVSIV